VLADNASLHDDVLAPMALDRDDIVDQFGVAARTLANLPQVHRAMERATGRAEVVIVGFGRFGQALLRELQALERSAVCVTLVDRKARDKATQWNTENPSPWRIVGDETRDGLRWATALRGHPPDVVFLCLDNDAMSLRIATTLRKKLPNLVLVLRMNTELVDGEGLISCSIPRLFEQALEGILSRRFP
jgi:malic enzyme